MLKSASVNSVLASALARFVGDSFERPSRTFRAASILASIISAGLVHAAAPDVKSVFPPGAAVGATVEVEATGTLALPGTQVWFSQPGLKAELPESGSKLKIIVPPDAQPGLALLRFHNAEGASGLVPFLISRLPDVRDTEPNNSTAKPQKLESNAVVSGKFAEAGDVDVFAIDAKKGQSLVAFVEANWRLSSAADVVLQLLDPKGVVLEQIDDDHGNDPLLAFDVPADGTYFIRTFAFPAQPNSSVRFHGGADYHYRLTITTGAFGDHLQPSVLSRGKEASAKVIGWNIPPELNAVALTGADQTQFVHPALPDPLPLAVLDGDVFSETEPSDKSTPQPVTINSVVCGTISAARDEDWYSLKVAKGDKLQLEMESRQFGLPLDAVLQIFSADGKQIAESDDEQRGSPDPTLKYTAAADGEIRLRVRDIFGHGGWRYAYRLWIKRLEPTVELKLAADRIVVMPDMMQEVVVNVTRNDGFNAEIDVAVDGLPKGITCDVVKSAAMGDSSKQVKLQFKSDGSEAFHGPVRLVGRWGDKSQTAVFDIPAARTPINSLWLTAPAKKVEPKPEADKTEKKEGDKKDEAAKT